MLDVSNKFEGTIVIFTDITERKKNEERLKLMSFHDMMTGLYNRAYMMQEMVRLSTGRFNPIGVISCDIDGLKLVNDSLGHGAGDILIATVSKIISRCFRGSDVAARVGGDEFLVFLPFGSNEIVQAACQRLRDAMATHNQKNETTPISISIGWSTGNPETYKDMEELITIADSLMYKEKEIRHTQFANLLKQLLFERDPVSLFSKG